MNSNEVPMSEGYLTKGKSLQLTVTSTSPGEETTLKEIEGRARRKGMTTERYIMQLLRKSVEESPE